MFYNRRFNNLVNRLSNMNLLMLAGIYILAYLAVDLLVHDPIRHYNFCVLLSLSGIYFSWFAGGRRAMAHVSFFNIFFVFIFSKLLWDQGKIIYGGQLFLGRSFLVIYILGALLLLVIALKKSPADTRRERQSKTIEQERNHRQNLEFMVASRKLTRDMIAQANMVKDELQLMEGTWKSSIHNILNDLPPVKEQELYHRIILPFQENIVQHLRNLEAGLTFDLRVTGLPELGDFLNQKITATKKMGVYHPELKQLDPAWHSSRRHVLIDKNKVWDMLVNVLRNSQAALELQHIGRLEQNRQDPCTPRIRVTFGQGPHAALLTITDNGGGLADDQLPQIYREPLPSRKRGDKSPGQGTLFVKFFAERMGIRVRAEKTAELDGPGLKVVFQIPFEAEKSITTRETGGLKMP